MASNPLESVPVKFPRDVFDSVKEVYDKVGYGQQYGLDIWITVVLIVVFFCATAYFYVLGHLQPIKADWPVNRCNPAYIPFAGIINPPENSSAMNYTSENFEYCTQNILKEITGYFLAPFYYLMNVIRETVDEMRKAANAIRQEFDKIRDALSNITAQIMARVENAIVPLTKMVITVRDLFAKTAGVVMTGMYTFMTAYMGLNSIFAIIIDGILAGLILLAALIIPLWFIPFVGPPLAIADTAVFVAILSLFIIFKVFLSEVMGIASGDAPPIPACFAKGTSLIMKEGKTRPIEEVKIGDVLIDDGVVTGVMKMCSRGQDVFDIDGVLVTGRHRVFHPEVGLIQAASHPAAVRIHDFREEYVYCVNTSTKRLVINSEVYVDWDDLDPMDMYELDLQCARTGIVPHELSGEDIHHHLECGLAGGSMVELDDGRSVPIQEVEVNDVLRFGETVLGIVKLDARDVVCTKEYNLDTTRSLRGSGNVLILDGDLGTICTYSIDGTEVQGERYLYHLVTDVGSFVTDGVRVGDYNTGLEQHLKPALFLSR